jgi:Stress-activated map kinase interacting protein 1 (SIN1)
MFFHHLSSVGHRRRSDTAQRLDKLKRDKQKQSQIKHVQWRATYHTGNQLTYCCPLFSVHQLFGMAP